MTIIEKIDKNAPKSILHYLFMGERHVAKTNH